MYQHKSDSFILYMSLTFWSETPKTTTRFVVIQIMWCTCIWRSGSTLNLTESHPDRWIFGCTIRGIEKRKEAVSTPVPAWMIHTFVQKNRLISSWLTVLSGGVASHYTWINMIETGGVPPWLCSKTHTPEHIKDEGVRTSTRDAVWDHDLLIMGGVKGAFMDAFMHSGEACAIHVQPARTYISLICLSEGWVLTTQDVKHVLVHESISKAFFLVRREGQGLNFLWVIDGNDCRSKLNRGQVKPGSPSFVCVRDAVRTQVEMKREKKDGKQKITTLAFTLRIHVTIEQCWRSLFSALQTSAHPLNVFTSCDKKTRSLTHFIGILCVRPTQSIR